MISLLKNISFKDVAKQLSLNVPRYSLPSSSVCPVCQSGKMRFYHDGLTGGCACYCDQCKHSGDLVSLLGAVWKLDDMTVCRRMRELHIADISSFEFDLFLKQRESHKRHVDRGERMLQAAMRPGLLDDGRMPEVVQRLNMRMEVRYTNARSYCPQIFGCSSREDLLIAQSVSERSKRARMRNSKDYDAGFAVPFFDLPGRPLHFAVLTRRLGDSKLSESRVSVGYSKYPEDGIACHPDTILRPSSCVIMTPHTEVAVRAWSRCSLTHFFDFPLIIAKEHTNCWQLLGNLPRIVWATSTNDTEAIALAARTNSNLHISTPRSSDIADYIRRIDFNRFYRQLVLSKRPWTKTLAQLMQSMTVSQATTYLQTLSLTDDEISRLRDDEPQTTSGLVKSYFAHKIDNRSIGYRTGHLEQTSGGWTYVSRRHREVVTNASITLISITTYGDREVVHANVSCEGKHFEIQHDYQAFKNNSYQVISKHCLRNQCVFVSPAHWHSRLHAISLMFSRPQVHVGDNYVGYDSTKRQWSMPTYTIKGGRLQRRHGIPSWLPLPGQLQPVWRGWYKALSDMHPCVLAAAALVFEQFTGDIQNKPRSPVMFSGPASLVSVGLIRKALCAASKHDPDNHKWLLIPDTPFSSGKLATRDMVAASFVTGAWLHTSDMQRCYGLFRGAYSLADHSESFIPSAEHVGILASMMLFLLKYWKPCDSASDYMMDSLSELNSELNTNAVRSRFVLDVEPATSFLMLLKEIHQSHKPIYGEAVAGRKHGVVRPSQDKQSMFIPSSVIESAVHKLRLGVYENVSVLQRLSASRHFRGYVADGNEQGWIIDKTFFDSSVANDALKIKTFQLRVVS